jgi:hypothetical protein
MGLSIRRVLNTLLLIETFATLVPGSHGSHLRQVVETPGNQYNRIDQSYDTKENAAEELTGPVLDSHLSKEATPSHTRSLIIGGRPTDPGEYPYFATTKSNACGASLIHPDILLTAAHCQDDFARDTVVYVGAHELDTLATSAEKRTIIRQYPHPDNHDLMLFQLNKPVDTLPVVTLNSDPDLPRLNATLTAIGFGATSTEPLIYSESLMAVDVYPIDPDTCVRQYNDTVTVDPDTMLCAGRSLPNHDSCNGDSGGPLLDKATGKQVGIVSFGKGCGDPDFPGVYTRISTYTSWIHDRICELSAVPPADCPAPNSTAKAVELINVHLFIKYDSRQTESFWRLEDDATGQAVAFQPKLPERDASFSQVIPLPPGKYTLHLTDTAGDGICCGHGKGKIVISADVQPNAGAEAHAVTVRSRADNVLAHSDGQFAYQLSLPFVVVSGEDGTDYTNSAYIHVEGHGSNLMAIMIAIAIFITVILGISLIASLRCCTTPACLMRGGDSSTATNSVLPCCVAK